MPISCFNQILKFLELGVGHLVQPCQHVHLVVDLEVVFPFPLFHGFIPQDLALEIVIFKRLNHLCNLCLGASPSEFSLDVSHLFIFNSIMFTHDYQFYK